MTYDSWMSEPDDWRLQGQDRYLQGVTLEWRRCRSPRPSWDHDHCDFCWAKFAESGRAEAPIPEALAEGYTTTDAHPRGAEAYWVCEPCFEDFHERFEWSVATREG